MMDTLDTVIAILPFMAGGLALMLSRGRPRARRRAGARGENTERDGRVALDEAGPPGLAAGS